MKCKSPVTVLVNGRSIPVGCGQCMPCLFNKSRIWQHRLILESLHGDSQFVTLTYRDPAPESVKRDVSQKYIKRIRKAIEPKRIKFFGVGEYGEKGFRPHYHYAFFNIGTRCRKVGYCVQKEGKEYVNCKGIREKEWCVFKKKWKDGNVFVGDVTRDSARYMTGYLTKKCLKEDEWKKQIIGNLNPEFRHMSKNIGVKSVEKMAEVIKKSELYRVVSTLNHGKRIYPLGRHLKGKINDAIGTDSNLLDMELEAYLELTKDPSYWEMVQERGRRLEKNSKDIFRKRRRL